ncbi:MULTISPECIES: MarR family winged helix-turn-helix transcriptional regulator [Micromonospora]|uniref:DNA-binding transcriptional regulator, MarR family n=1 Tax=Micromonospora carbonacea TaxID=47853 RepID=A0A1C5A723_9ACTN|nr:MULTISPECIES: MarR family transcriptional regulator [Micromonospora]WFE59865.1 MarR family transcriptional regulator [Micromonospora sp. WMMD712]SCF41053.1 DNA-binding transcriptional regulator, MarR family [Micromonospora carbonacea]
MDLIGLGDVPLGRLLVTAGHVVGQRWNRYLAEEHGLTQAGMVTLLTLARHGELPLRAVAEAGFIRPATLTGIVDTLERDGLVERQRDDADRRSVRLVLTPAGRERIAALTTLMQSGRPLTSVDADPAKAAVIRQFLLEVIGSGEEPDMTNPDTRPETSAC